MKQSKELLRRLYHGRALAFSFTCLMFLKISLPLTWAGPEGAQIIHGDVSIQQSAYNTTITASDKAIINYSSFDIARPETVQFIQPSNSASVLNRIISASPTHIDGTLMANGRVFFVNPAGIYIGAGATVNVNQLVASGLNITNSDFINGQYNFAGGNGFVINSGDISAEEVYLIGRQVTNSGHISCPAGYVVMASGDRVFLGEPGSEIVLEVDESFLSGSTNSADSGAGVLNEGTVEAGAGIIALAAAGDIYSQAISNVGSLSVSVETGNAGEVKLIATEGTVINSGTVEATSSSGTGGTVQMLGDKVGLFDTGQIDVSGSDGGGTVLVGGGYQGKGNVLTASRTYVSPDSSIRADATENGDGGKVIVWADEIARFYGDISARGGSEGGDGGFVEVSGRENLGFRGNVNTVAPQGNIGTLLLDPLDIEVVAGGGLELTDVDEFGDAGSDPDVSQISPTTINGAATNVILQAKNSITINNSINMRDDNIGITAQAGDYIEVNASITTRGGTLDFTANDSGGTQSGSGYIDLNAALDTTQTGLTGGGVLLTVDGGTGDIQLGDNITTNTANITFKGSVTLTADSVLSTTTGVGGDISFDSDVSGDHLLTLTAGTGNIDFFSTVGGITPLSGLLVNSAATLDLDNTVALDDQGLNITAGTIGIDNMVTATTGGAINIANTGVLTVASGAYMNLDGAFDQDGAGAVNMGGNISTTGDDISFLQAVTLTDHVALSTGAGVGGNIIFRSTLNGTTDLSENLTLTAGTGNLDFDATVGEIHDLGDVTTNSATNVTIDGVFNANYISITAVNTTAQDVTAAGNLTLNSTTTVGNGLTLRAGDDLNVGAASLIGNGALTLIATGGSISGSGTIQANDGVGTQGDLTLRQGDSLNLASLTFGNQSTTNLVAQSYNGGITIDKTKPANAADQWQSIAAMAQNNIELLGIGNINIASTGLSSTSGGVKVISDTGTISTPGAGGALDAPITGYSDTSGIGVDLPNGTGKAALVIRGPSQDLALGANATLTANGIYSLAVDDRTGVWFDVSGPDAGDPIDVAIYLGTYEPGPTGAPEVPYHDVAIDSQISIANYGTMVIDADETVTFGNTFGGGSPPPNQTTRLEVVSRISQTLDEVIKYSRLPYADNPALIVTRFLGKYVLRGDTLLADVLALIEPVPWAVPRPLELEIGSEVEGRDTEALEKLLNELGIGVQPYVTEAYASSLNTDLRLFSAAEKLQRLIPVLEDANSTVITALRGTITQFFPSLDDLSEERVSSFTQELERHKGDGTDYDAAGQCIFALTEYVTILGNDIGWPADKSIGFVMSRYVPRLSEGDEIRIAVIQIQLQKAFGI